MAISLPTYTLCFGIGEYDTVKVSKVEGHADQFMVAECPERQDDLVGNDGADTAADLGRLRQNDAVISARRALLSSRGIWYPIVVDLLKFLVDVSRLIMFEQSVWHRLLCEKVVRPHLRARRPLVCVVCLLPPPHPPAVGVKLSKVVSSSTGCSVR